MPSRRVLALVVFSPYYLVFSLCSEFFAYTPHRFGQMQQILEQVPAEMHTWRVVVSDIWDVLGPFPIQAREQHFLSPSYPVNLSQPVDYDAWWPSAYADGGSVSWSKVESVNGALSVSFPDVRWASLRASEGWAALQHHILLHTTITVYPPTGPSRPEPPRLFIDLKQGSFFAVLPRSSVEETSESQQIPKWHAGNIYSMNAAPPQSVPLPNTPSLESATAYDVFVSGDYEIRLFGDPAVRHSDVPELQITFDVGIENPTDTFTHSSSHNIVPDFIEGWAFGEAIGVGIRTSGGWWTVNEVRLGDGGSKAISTTLVQETRLAPTQTRIIPIRLSQEGPFLGSEINLVLVGVSSTGTSMDITITLPVNHHQLWDSTEFHPIVSSYFFATSMPAAFLSIPPKQPNQDKPQTPLLALHGAGVDILSQPAWDCLPPRQSQSWVLVPTGRTAWGLDWHGPSASDAWSTVGALAAILHRYSFLHQWSFPGDSKVLLMGHSNGGQGTWYMASRYPDRVLAAVPAAAYIKSQSYVPLVQSRSAHFIDPSLRAILESSLTADDNDLFLSNLVDIPVLAIHGGNDDNVPVWHSRQLVDVLKTWNKDANVTLIEDPGQLHCYPTIFNNERVQSFVDDVLSGAITEQSTRKSHSFTLTVAIPSESGSMHGWKIESLGTPGRLGRLTVEEKDEQISVTTSNILAFSISKRASDTVRITIDGQQLSRISGPHKEEHSFVKDGKVWQERAGADSFSVQPTGRALNILSSRSPITFVIPNKTDVHTLHVALRIVHDLDVYHKLDAAILDAAEAITLMEGNSLGHSNVVSIGGSENAFSQHILNPRLNDTPFQMHGQTLHLKGLPLVQDSTAVFLHPHPTSVDALMMFIYSNDAMGLERGARLFPIRTGIPMPDWVIVHALADSRAAGGVQASGVWGNEWSWNEAMSSF